MINLTYDELALQATALFDEMNRRRREAARNAPEGRGWVNAPELDDEVHTELLEALTSWDDDPLGTLEELRFQSGYYED